jgi:hypothetical protein
MKPKPQGPGTPRLSYALRKCTKDRAASSPHAHKIEAGNARAGPTTEAVFASSLTIATLREGQKGKVVSLTSARNARAEVPNGGLWAGGRTGASSTTGKICCGNIAFLWEEGCLPVVSPRYPRG